MKIFSHRKFRNIRAQAMVEFMLALPLLLLLIYGTIEVARLIFIFSSVANASRQAARYGSGAGEINDIYFYQNCAGIREVANRSAYVVEFEEINITYDRGVESDGTQIPIEDIDPDPEVDSCPIEDYSIRNGDRIIVQVKAQYEPIISIIPIEPLTVVSASARTFLVSVPILGSALPTGFAAESPTPSKVPTSTLATNTATTVPAFTATRLPSSGNTPSNPIPTNSGPPTLTFTPSKTPFPTVTPSITPTQISCSGLTGIEHGPLKISKNYMEMSIINNSGYTLSTAEIYVEWNHDRGHEAGNDSTLRLRQISFADQIWDGDLFAPSAYITAYHPYIPVGESTIRFIFNQNYDLTDGTERIIIYISTPGCVNYPVDSSKN